MIKTIYLLTFIICSRIFYGIPSGFYYYTEMLVSLISAFYLSMKIYQSNRVYKYEILILLILFIPFLNSIAAYSTFGQDVFFGILARRDVLTVFIPMALARFWDESSVARRVEFINTIMLFCKLYLVAVVLLSLLVNPIYFVGLYGIDNPYVSFFIDYSASLDGYRYKPSFFPIVILLFYYIFQQRAEGIASKLWVILCFYWLVFLYGGRGLLLSLVLTLLIVSLIPFYKIKVKDYLTRLMYFSFAIIVSILIFVLFYDYFNDRIVALLNAASIFDDTSSVDDVSVIARREQLNTIANYLNFNTLIWGFGTLSAQWNGGFEAVFGRFHPSDLGILGAVLVNGLCGILLLLIPYYIYIKRLAGFKSGFGISILILFSLITVPTGFIFFHCVILVYLSLMIRVIESVK